MLHTALHPHPEIARFLAHDPLLNLFPRFVCAARPDGASLAALDGDRIVGAVVCGRDFGIVQVQSPWLAAASPDAARALIAALAAQGRLDGLQLPFAGAEALLADHPGYRVSRDVVLRRPPGPVAAKGAHGQLRQVDAELLRRVVMPDDIRAGIGPLRDLPEGAPLWALEVEGRLVALADTIVAVDDLATVQQVYCTRSERRRGHGAALLAQLLAHPSVAGATLTWLASAENTASIRLARGLGFGEEVSLGCVERVGGQG